MPMRWRRIIDSIAFIFAVGVAAWVKYGLDSSWYAAIGWAALVFFLTPFIITRVWGIYKLRYMERHATELIEKIRRGEPLD
jgi:uncharacterized membrane protein